MNARTSSALVKDGLMKIDETGAFLGKSRTWVYGEMNAGRLPYTMVGGGRRIPRRAVVKLAAKNMVAAGA